MFQRNLLPLKRWLYFNGLNRIISHMIDLFISLVGFDPVTTAVWLVFFDSIVLIILHQTMAYASSICPTFSLAEIFTFSLTVSQALLMSVSSPKFSKVANLFRILTETVLYFPNCTV
jgi:hypothetical protein